MNINIDDLSFGIIFKKDYDLLMSIVNKNVEKSALSFLKDDDKYYWWLVFNELIGNFSGICYEFFTKSEMSDDEFNNLISNFIKNNLHKIFHLYEGDDYFDLMHHFYDSKKSKFSIMMTDYVNKNFEQIHSTFGGVLFLIQNVKNNPMIKPLMNAYEQHPMLSKYFKFYDKILKDDIKYFKKFWSFLILYQKIPISYIYKYIKNFEDVKELKDALNKTHNYQYYWNELQKNRNTYQRLKSFN